MFELKSLKLDAVLTTLFEYVLYHRIDARVGIRSIVDNCTGPLCDLIQ